MKKILCPTDLKHIDKNALEYALRLGEKYGSEIILFHALEMDSEEKTPETAGEGDGASEDPAKKMQRVIEDLKQELGSPTEVRTLVLAGEPSGAIVETAIAEEVDLVVMTPHLKPSPEKPLLSSTTLGVLEHVDRPVMIVPEDARFSNIANIGYVTNFEEGDFKVIDRLLKLAQLFRAQIHCVHIRPQTEFWGHKQREMYERLYLIESTNSLVSMHVIKKESITRALIDFIAEEEIDVMALLISHPEMLREIYRDSRSYNLSLHTTVPVLAFQV